MGAVLFKVFGFDITGKLLFRAGLGVAAAVVLYLAFDAVRDHFNHITDLEQQNEQFNDDLTRAEAQRDQVIETNAHNQEVSKLEDTIQENHQQIAEAERRAVIARTQTYKEIRDAIQAIPPSSNDEPVAPVIRDTLDRLWNTDSPTGGPDRRP